MEKHRKKISKQEIGFAEISLVIASNEFQNKCARNENLLWKMEGIPCDGKE